MVLRNRIILITIILILSIIYFIIFNFRLINLILKLKCEILFVFISGIFLNYFNNSRLFINFNSFIIFIANFVLYMQYNRQKFTIAEND